MSNQRIFDHALLFEVQTLILSHFFECDKGITVPLKLYNNIVPLLSFFIGILLEELKKFVDFSTNQSMQYRRYFYKCSNSNSKKYKDGLVQYNKINFYTSDEI